MTSETLLPEEFADLEPFAQRWALPTATERYQRRVDSTMPELQAFYDAMVPRGDQAFAYLDQFPLDDMPDQALHLLWLLLSLSAVSFAVDCFKQVRVPDSGDVTNMPWTVEPVP
jgi:hypothetical protein